jgi:hypothetical protein
VGRDSLWTSHRSAWHTSLFIPQMTRRRAA